MQFNTVDIYMGGHKPNRNDVSSKDVHNDQRQLPGCIYVKPDLHLFGLDSVVVPWPQKLALGIAGQKHRSAPWIQLGRESTGEHGV